MEDREEEAVFSIWVDWENRVISFSEENGFEKECNSNPILSYSLRLQKALSNEVRLHGAAVMLEMKRKEWEKKDVIEIPTAAFTCEPESTDQPVKRIDFSKIFKAVTPIAVAACMVCGCARLCWCISSLCGFCNDSRFRRASDTWLCGFLCFSHSLYRQRFFKG